MRVVKQYKLITGILFAVAGLTSHMAAAQTGQAIVNFVGTIQEAGCQIDPSTKDQAIDFGTVGADNFNISSGFVNGSQQPVNIKLTNCPASVSLAKIEISGTPAINANNLAIATGTGAATGLAIMFKNLNGVWIKLNDATSDPGQPLSQGSNTLRYIAALTNYGTVGSSGGVVTPGTVNATCTYTIEYQ